MLLLLQSPHKDHLKIHASQIYISIISDPYIIIVSQSVFTENLHSIPCHSRQTIWGEQGSERSREWVENLVLVYTWSPCLRASTRSPLQCNVHHPPSSNKVICIQFMLPEILVRKIFKFKSANRKKINWWKQNPTNYASSTGLLRNDVLWSVLYHYFCAPWWEWCLCSRLSA